MARPGRPEDTSVPIWLKLSAADSAKMDQVLARPEFEGWTKGEWCLEIIQTALRYYTRPRPAGEPGRKRTPARPAVKDPPATAARRTSSRREPEPAAPERRRLRPGPGPGPEAAGPESLPAPAEPERVDSERADSERVGSDVADSAEFDALDEAECSHPAEARDYQSGTCAACGAILWD